MEFEIAPPVRKLPSFVRADFVSPKYPKARA